MHDDSRFTDEDGVQLIKLLHKYVTLFSPDIPQTLSALTEDLTEWDGELAASYAARAEALAQEIRDTAGVS